MPINSSEGPPPFPAFNKLDTVQDVLDRNKSLLQQIKANHSSQAPDDLAKNCVLIKELNGNIARVVQLYQEISESYVRYMGLSPSELSAPSPAKQGTGGNTGNTGTGNDLAAGSGQQQHQLLQPGGTPPPVDAGNT